MSRILLDTCAYSAFKRGHVAMFQALQGAREIFLTPVVIGELHCGFLKGNRVESNVMELEQFMASPRVDVLPMDEETGHRYATILRGLQEIGRPIPTNDVWIASSAMQYGLRLLTTDRHFLEIPQIVTEHHAP